MTMQQLGIMHPRPTIKSFREKQLLKKKKDVEQDGRQTQRDRRATLSSGTSRIINYAHMRSRIISRERALGCTPAMSITLRILPTFLPEKDG